jgi:hypothetical protein
MDRELANRIKVNCEFEFAEDNRSIISPDGDIFLVGG